MLDGILGRGFSSRCKSLIKATRSRIELVRRRAEAKQRFLKEDLAKLLANGLDINAYGRTEEFMAGQGLLSCYGFIELSCEYILKQLPNMQKQSDCPEECREALASLMFAAARFSDLPELRDIRDLIQARYGTGLECFVNQKFVEQLSSRTPAVEKRIQLLQDIASEFRIRWDSTGFQQRMACAEGKLNKIGPSQSSANTYNLGSQKGSVSKTNGQIVFPKEKPEASNDHQIRIQGGYCNGINNDKMEDHLSWRKDKVNEHKLFANKEGSYPATEKNDFPVYRKEELTVDRNIAKKEKYNNSQRTSKSGNSSHGRGKDGVHSGYEKQERQNCYSHDVPKDKRQLEAASSYTGLTGKSDDFFSTCDLISEKKKPISTRESQEEDGNNLKSYNGYARPPPYVKSKDKIIPPPYVKSGDNKDKTSRGFDHSSHGRVDAGSSSEDIHRESYYPDQKVENLEPTGKNSHRQDRELSGIPLPKPRSVRRRHHKSSRNNDDAGNSEDGSRSNRRREHSKKGLQVLLDDEHHRRDDEEKMIDKLLMHYSKKSSNYDIEKLRKKPHNQSSHERDPPPPTRSMSLPHEQAETTKVYTRANSFQPDHQAPHVHPKLPDYADLAARFAALRGR